MAALAQYVAFQFALGRRTMFEGVERVPPATWLEGHGVDILREHRFWQPNQEIDIESEQQAVELVRSILDDTMRLQLRADVPVGSSLSGGLDSSVVCSLASQQLGAPLPAFHGRFDAGRSFDEWPYADALARSIGTELRVVTPTPNDFVAAMPEIIRLLDEPVAGPGSFPQFMVSRTASSEVKVMLGGQGGDEIFGGYARYLIAYLEQALKGAITGTQEEGKHIVTLENVVPQLRVLETYFPLMREFWSKGLFDDMNRRYFALIDRSRGVVELLDPEVRSELDFDAVFDEYAMIFADAPTPSYINKMLGFDMVTLLPALLQVEDRMSMGASLESRVPFLDTRLVDALGRISPGIKFTAGVGKHVLRLAADGLLPPVVAERTDKMGFPVPLVEWMDHPAVDEFVRDTILTSTGPHRPLVDGTAARRLLDDGTYTNRQLWGLLSLQLWNQTFIDA